MYVVYLSKTIDVKLLAAIWSQPYYTIRNGELQSFHHVLCQRDYASLIPTHVSAYNARLIRLDNCTVDQLPALEMTGVMEDPEFVLLGYVTDEHMAMLYNAHREAFKNNINEILDLLREDAFNAIDEKGVYDRITIDLKKRTILFKPEQKVCVSQVRSLDEVTSGKKQYIADHINAVCPNNASYLMLKGVDYTV